VQNIASGDDEVPRYQVGSLGNFVDQLAWALN
jgi:hypothetical protein